MDTIRRCFPDLSPDRVNYLVSLVAKSRDYAADVMKPLAKVNWGSGCAAYEQAMWDLLEESDSGKTPWLKAKRELGMAYTVLVGNTPIRLQSEAATVRPVMPSERIALDALCVTIPMFADEYMPRGILRMGVSQRARRHVSRIAIGLFEEHTERLLDTWIVYQDGKAIASDIADLSKGKPAQDVDPGSEYEFFGISKAENDDDEV